MRAEAKVCDRLVAALEDLAAQEAASLAAGDIATLQHLQQRADPIIARLGEYGPDADEGLRARIGRWLSHRRETARLLARRISGTKAALDHLDASRRRVARVGPAYGQAPETSRRLSAVG